MTQYARGLLTDEYLPVDLDERDWQMSIALIAGGLSEYENLALIVVPVAPHMSGRWLNGRVPALTFKAEMIPTESLQDLRDKYIEMAAVLFPDEADEIRNA